MKNDEIYIIAITTHAKNYKSVTKPNNLSPSEEQKKLSCLVTDPLVTERKRKHFGRSVTGVTAMIKVSPFFLKNLT